MQNYNLAVCRPSFLLCCLDSQDSSIICSCICSYWLMIYQKPHQKFGKKVLGSIINQFTSIIFIIFQKIINNIISILRTMSLPKIKHLSRVVIKLLEQKILPKLWRWFLVSFFFVLFWSIGTFWLVTPPYFCFIFAVLCYLFIMKADRWHWTWCCWVRNSWYLYCDDRMLILLYAIILSWSL